jgi:hypothetical protein
MDIQGSEQAAIEGLGEIMKGQDEPVVAYESNAMTFEIFGYSIDDIRRRFISL